MRGGEERRGEGRGYGVMGCDMMWCNAMRFDMMLCQGIAWRNNVIQSSPTDECDETEQSRSREKGELHHIADVF